MPSETPRGYQLARDLDGSLLLIHNGRVMPVVSAASARALAWTIAENEARHDA